jgi:hypothetical protein
MVIYANGDSHTAGAEAVNTYAFANDDPALFYMGRQPHPENALVAWPRILGDLIKMPVHNNAESASSNQRIMRTTREWLDTTTHQDIFAIIQWSTWERKEWLYEDTYYQVTASGTDDLPPALEQQYKEFIATSNWNQEAQQAHEEIWAFHQELNERDVPHLFFNGNWAFDTNYITKLDWGTSYIGPYDSNLCYAVWLKNNGFHTVAPNSYHYGKKEHTQWARFVLQYIVDNKLVHI